ncbi:MAG: radical SAM protein [Caldicoprobacterales bacterium]
MKKNFKIVPVFIPMLGCKFKCVFCNQHIITGHKDAAFKQIESQIEQGMAHISKDKPCDEIAFFGGSFTCLPVAFQKQVLDLAKPYIDKGLAKGIRISTRPDYIDTASLELLEDANVTTIELGIQSTNERVLFHSGRGHTVSCIFDSARLIKDKAFKLGLQMMVGLPKDTREIAIKTASDIISLEPDYVRIYPTLVLKGSSLEEMLKTDDYKAMSLEEAIDQVCHLKIMFDYNGIKVIRTGLQSNEDLDLGRGLVEGPYHPAFGELVESQILYKWFKYAIDQLIGKARAKIEINVNPKDLSKAIGQRRANLSRLRLKYPASKITIGANDSIEKEEILMIVGHEQLKITKLEFYENYLKASG